MVATFQLVRAWTTATVIVAVLAASASAGAVQPTRPPTQAQVSAAIKKAKRSTDLWATVNVCNTRSHPNSIGIRAQIPSLGFTSRMYVDIQVEYWSSQASAFEPVPRARALIALGRAARDVFQGGALFPFDPHAGLLTGRVTFEWRRGSKLLGRVTRPTTRGHPQADFGDPPRYSSSKCEIP